MLYLIPLLLLLSLGSYGVDAQILQPIRTPTRVETDYNLAIDAIFSMGVRLQALLYDDDNEKNFLISPISATTVIGELMLATDGVFLKELYDLLSLPHIDQSNVLYVHTQQKNISFSLSYSKLHLQLSQLLRKLSNSNSNSLFTLETPSIIFYSEKVKLLPDFLQKLRLYYTFLYPLGFSSNPIGSFNTINNWVERNTHGLIRQFLPYPPTPNTQAIFANIIYFKGDWEVPFSFQLNQNGVFRQGNNKTVNVTYMMGEMEQIPYMESKDLGCKMIGLPYKNNELYMYIILPTEENYNIKTFVRNLKMSNVQYLINNLKLHDVTLKLPKVSITSTIRLLEPLKKYASFKKRQDLLSKKPIQSLDDIQTTVDNFAKFNQTQNPDIVLTNASITPLKVDDIIQQIKLTIDEKGTEAAAVTAGFIDYFGGSRDFNVDKPFTFFIRHEETTAVLFWGTIIDPTQSN